MLEDLSEIKVMLRAIASQAPPNWQRSLKAYPKFDWAAIGATVVRSDDHGATVVQWCGHAYIRRAGENKKFGACIWFSRAIGKDGDEAVYGRLITFKDLSHAEPLPAYVVNALR